MRVTTSLSFTFRIGCPTCGHRFEVRQDHADVPAEQACPQCGALIRLPARRLDQAVGAAVGEALAGARLAPAGALPAGRDSLRRLALAANLLGGLVALWAIFLPRPYPLALGAAAALPHGLLVLPWASEGRIRLTDTGRTRLPHLSVGFLAPLLAVALRGVVDFQLAAYRPLLGPLLGLTGFDLILVLALAAEFRQAPARLFLLVPFLLAFTFGGTIAANCLLDASAPRAYQVRVLGKRVSTSRNSHTYYLKVSPWGPRAADNEITVRRRLYEGLRLQDPLTIRLRSGFLGAEWYTVRPEGP